MRGFALGILLCRGTVVAVLWHHEFCLGGVLRSVRYSVPRIFGDISLRVANAVCFLDVFHASSAVRFAGFLPWFWEGESTMGCGSVIGTSSRECGVVLKGGAMDSSAGISQLLLGWSLVCAFDQAERSKGGLERASSAVNSKQNMLLNGLDMNVEPESLSKLAHRW